MAVVKTAKIYKSGLFRTFNTLGNFYAWVFSGKLAADGKLHSSQFYLCEQDHVPVLTSINDILEEEIVSANIRKTCFAFFSKFVECLFHYLFDESSLQSFLRGETSRQAIVTAREEQARARADLSQVQEKIKTDDAYKAFNADIQNNHEAWETFRTEIAGQRQPLAAVDIGMYLESDHVQSMFNQITDMVVDEERVPTHSRVDEDLPFHG